MFYLFYCSVKVMCLLVVLTMLLAIGWQLLLAIGWQLLLDWLVCKPEPLRLIGIALAGL